MADFNYALAALGCVATASGSDGGYPPSQAIDGSDVTYWSANQNYGSWIQLDFGAPIYIVSFVIKQPTTNAWAQVIYTNYSNDGSNWLSLAQQNGVQGDVTINTGGLAARYWRFTMSNTPAAHWRVYTLQALGPVTAPPPPTNPVVEPLVAWLDGLEANLAPTVDDWLADN